MLTPFQVSILSILEKHGLDQDALRMQAPVPRAAVDEYRAATETSEIYGLNETRDAFCAV